MACKVMKRELLAELEVLSILVAAVDLIEFGKLLEETELRVAKEFQ